MNKMLNGIKNLLGRSTKETAPVIVEKSTPVKSPAEPTAIEAAAVFEAVERAGALGGGLLPTQEGGWGFMHIDHNSGDIVETYGATALEAVASSSIYQKDPKAKTVVDGIELKKILKAVEQTKSGLQSWSNDDENLSYSWACGRHISNDPRKSLIEVVAETPAICEHMAGLDKSESSIGLN